jgi:hypothetical protein
MNLLKSNILKLNLLLSLFFTCLGYAAPPTAKDYVQFYNEHRGVVLRDHYEAEKKLKEKFEEVALNQFDGNLSKFYINTTGSLAHYREQRHSAKWLQDHFTTSTSGRCVVILNHFVSEKAELALKAMAEGKQTHDDRIVDHLIQSAGKFNDEMDDESRSLIDMANNALKEGADGKSPLLMKVAAGFVVGIALYWFGPAYLMEGVKVLYPTAWTYLYGSIPAGLKYYTLYQPGLYKAMGLVFEHSTVILTTGWGVCSVAAQATCSVISGITGLAHYGMLEVYHHFNDHEIKGNIAATTIPHPEQAVFEPHIEMPAAAPAVLAPVTQESESVLQIPNPVPAT